MKKIYKVKEEGKKIRNADDLFENIKEIDIDYDQENFLVFFLDIRLKVISSEIMFKGGIDECAIDPRTLFRKALINKAVSVILAHNHPSESLSPSDADVEVSKMLIKAGEMINISVIDNVIFNKKEFFKINIED